MELAACHLDLSDATRDLGAALAQARDAGTSVYCLGYWGEFIGLPETVDWVRRAIEACGRHGVPMVNGSAGWLVQEPRLWDRDWRKNGSAMATDEDYAVVAAAYRGLADEAAAVGVRIGIEVHPNTVHDTVPAAARLLSLIDRRNVTVTLDPANAVPLAPDDPAELALLGGGPTYFHLKNCLAREGVADFTVDAANGVVDNYRWLAALLAAGTCPAVAVEYCGAGDPHPRLSAARRYLDDTLALLTGRPAGRGPQ
ncbi:sugar phosphate isomerase/epimerase [Plantactinospora sp. KBS50]|uniref:sugar phosphate isomerase/epimerase family protein n=1 Tax=Plantactinospora sp. KBS50 TaxID=2024580 RepID=UPI0012FE15CD|nr:TIM barrel protein [Plantactinospora sp. KBS50]